MLLSHSFGHTLLFPSLKTRQCKKGKLQLTGSVVKVPSSAVGITVAKSTVRTYPPCLESNSHHHEDTQACCNSTSVAGHFNYPKMSHCLFHIC
jgi:hypothetical protein